MASQNIQRTEQSKVWVEKDSKTCQSDNTECEDGWVRQNVITNYGTPEEIICLKAFNYSTYEDDLCLKEGARRLPFHTSTGNIVFTNDFHSVLKGQSV